MKVQAEPTPTGFRDRPMSQISGWGGRAVRAYEIVGEDLEHLTRDVPLSRGLGRSYGDSSLPPSSHPVVVGTTLSDRVLVLNYGRLIADGKPEEVTRDPEVLACYLGAEAFD